MASPSCLDEGSKFSPEHHACFTSRLKWKSDLGKGRFGRVVQALDRTRSDLPVAVKMINTHTMLMQASSNNKSDSGLAEESWVRTEREARARRYMIEEIESLRRAKDCAGLLQMMDYFEDRHLWSGHSYVYIVTEACDGGTLENALRTPPQTGAGNEQRKLLGDWRQFTDPEIAFLLLQLLDALLALESAGIVHRDIKPDNIFIHCGDAFQYSPSPATGSDPFTWRLTLGDFGLAKIVQPIEPAALAEYATFLSSSTETSTGQHESILNHSKPMTIPSRGAKGGTQRNSIGNSPFSSPSSWKANTMVGTPFYMSPEVLAPSDSDGYTHPADAWAVGIILFRLLLLQLPYAHVQSLAELQQHMLGNAQPGPLRGKDKGIQKMSLQNVPKYWHPLLHGLLAHQQWRWTAICAARYVLDIAFASKWTQTIDTFLAMRLATPHKTSPVLQLLLNRASNPETLMSDSFQHAPLSSNMHIGPEQSSYDRMSSAFISSSRGKFSLSNSSLPSLCLESLRADPDDGAGVFCFINPAASASLRQSSGNNSGPLARQVLLLSPHSTKDVKIKTITVPFNLMEYLDRHPSL
jgi:serine/threonine protein kinase